MARLPLSPNLEDRRFERPPAQPSWLQTLFGTPPAHMMPLVARGLQVLQGGMPGPAPTGQPYPSAPQPYAGTSILSQRLDPSTIMLSNQPPLQLPPPQPAPTEQYPTPTAGAYATQQPGPTLQGVMPRPERDPTFQFYVENSAGLTRGDARAAYRDLNKALKDPNMDPLDQLPTLRALIADGWLKVGPEDFDTILHFPGGRPGRERMVTLIDQLRPFLPQWETQQGYQNPPSGVPQPTPGG